jgi:hypothetical protein
MKEGRPWQKKAAKGGASCHTQKGGLKLHGFQFTHVQFTCIQSLFLIHFCCDITSAVRKRQTCIGLIIHFERENVFFEELNISCIDHV